MYAIRSYYAAAAVLVFARGIEPELLDLAGDGIAPDAQQLGRFDAPPTRALQRPLDERAFEGAVELFIHFARRGRQQAIGLAPEGGAPVAPA